MDGKYKIPALTLVAVFVLGVWCTSLASLGAQLPLRGDAGAASGCTQCDPPQAVCSSGFVPGPSFKAPCAFPWNQTPAKGSLGNLMPTLGGFSNGNPSPSNEVSLQARVYTASKVSIQLFNSVLVL